MANGDALANIPIPAAVEAPPQLPPLPTATTTSPQDQEPPTTKLHNIPPTSISFATIFSELQSYQQQNNGSLTIPTSHPALSRITDTLTCAGIDSIVDQRWEEQFSQLKLYRAQHTTGNNNDECNNVPELSHPTLGTWVCEQRECYRLYEQGQNTPLTPTRYEQLKSLNVFTSSINRWENKLNELKAFKAQHGHCDVPLDYPKLGVWVLNQRDTYHFEREEMGRERVDALEALAFNWNRWGRNRLKVREDAWDTQFQQLLEYIEEHGHSNISQHDKENERLGKWIKNQRYEYRKYHNKGLGPSRLGRDRIDKLNEIGFQWRLRPERIPWDERFTALVEYKEANGHCRVPMSVPELGKWAKYQRDQYCLFVRGKKAKITQQKIDMLLSIGFEDSLEERVAQNLTADMEMQHGEVEQQDSHHGQQQHHHHGEVEQEEIHGQQQQQQHHHVVKESDMAQQEEVIAYQHHHGEQQQQHAGQQQAYAEHYAGHVYGGAPHQQAPQPGSGAFHYQHGGVHYA